MTAGQMLAPCAAMPAVAATEVEELHRRLIRDPTLVTMSGPRDQLQVRDVARNLIAFALVEVLIKSV